VIDGFNWFKRRELWLPFLLLLQNRSEDYFKNKKSLHAGIFVKRFAEPEGATTSSDVSGMLG
jgi:hypothetical protein